MLKPDKSKKLTDEAIEELKRLLKDPDKRIRLRAISLILRHSDKAKQHDGNDKLDAYIQKESKEFDDLLKELNL